MAASLFRGSRVLEKNAAVAPAGAFGATFYAHQFVPGFATKPIAVTSRIEPCPHGCNAQSYALKVYGDPTAPASMKGLTEGTVHAWEWSREGVAAALASARVLTGVTIEGIDLVQKTVELEGGTVFKYQYLISTIPILSFMSILYRSTFNIAPLVQPLRSECKAQPIYITKEPHGPHLLDGQFFVEYHPCVDVPYYRSAIQGSERSCEYVSKPQGESRAVYPGKIQSSPTARQFTEVLSKLGVYCVGRYALWRKGYLSHDAWNDLCAIRQMID